MQKRDPSNIVFNLAADLVNHTSRHVFITGKAGTGKTTFLKFISEHTQKHAVVVAPTGVAAINAGGVTAHSFFQLPFGPFVPGSAGRPGDHSVTDRHSLFRNIRFSAARRELFQELELLIIDEISMVRCDMLDAIDTILRHFRRQPLLPFGGIQVVYIGDMFQLPPVIPQHEWDILKDYYDSPFFFDARVVKEMPPLYIELKKIYRQNEQHFIDILNRIRNNITQKQDLDELNKRFDPLFHAGKTESYITLTTHNRKADIINEAALKELPGWLFSFEAEITGEFSDNALPTDANLQLKEGAQVMFIKNDSGEKRRYYNGKLGIIKSISLDEIIVSFTNVEEELKLEKETWKNIRYTFNKENNNIDEEELGSFKQFPVRLAWAITIHKSQGLTFEKAVIDAGSSFAAGQVYVALSRCTSLEGLVLHSKINSHAISTDPRIIEFAMREANDEYLEKLLVIEKEKYQADQLVRAFSWEKILRSLQDWKSSIKDKKLPFIEKVQELNQMVLNKAVEQSRIAEKFQYQLRQLIDAGNEDLLEERVSKAVLYFSRFLLDEIVKPIQEHLSSLRYVSKVKKYYRELKTIEPVLLAFLQKLNHLSYKDLHFLSYDYSLAIQSANQAPAKKEKPAKGTSYRDSLHLFKEGKTIQEIASIRNLAASTVQGHLAVFVYTGEIDINELVSSQKTEAILNVMGQATMSATTIRNILGQEYSYAEIRAVMNYHRLLQEGKPVS